MSLLIPLFAVILLSALLYSEKRQNAKAILITKSILSLLFVLTAFLQPQEDPAYYHYLIAGLILCLMGDVFLALPGERMFQMGLVAFLVGHILYILSFLSLSEVSHWISSGTLAIFLISAAIFFWLRPYLKSMLFPVLIYILVITVMLSGAWAVFRESPLNLSARAFILVGAGSFYFSDLFVARDKFIQEAYRNRLIGLPLYYAGQFLLAFSVGLLK